MVKPLHTSEGVKKKKRKKKRVGRLNSLQICVSTCIRPYKWKCLRTEVNLDKQKWHKTMEYHSWSSGASGSSNLL